MIKRVNNKAFTLIELLAVIVILAVILTIAIPRVLNVIEESNKEAFRITGESLIRGAKDRLVYDMEETVEGKTYTIVDGAFVGDSIPMTGELPDNGTINVSREGITSMAISNDKWCAIKYENEDNILVNKDPNCVLQVFEEVPDICFTRTNNGVEVTITNYNDSCSMNPIIPSTLDGLPVRVIGEYSFSSKNLISVVIPNSVTSIRGEAFSFNQLTSITIPNGVTSIEYWAFANNQLTNVTISNSVTSIGDGAFFDNQLTSITIPNNVTSIGGGAFNDNQLPENQAFIYARNLDGSENTSIVVSYGGARRNNVIIPNSVTSIGDFAFVEIQLTSITIPNTVTSVGEGAFAFNQLTSVTIPANLEMSHEWTPQISDSFEFSYNTLYLKAEGTYTSSCQECNWTHSSLPMSEIPDTPVDCFAYTTTSTNVTITGYDESCSKYIKIPEIIEGKPVEHIGDSAFDNLCLLDGGNISTYLRLFESAKKDENNMLAYNNDSVFEKENYLSISSKKLLTAAPCIKIKIVVFPNTLKTIGDDAFSWNELTSITIPNSVTSIGEDAFYGNELTSVTIPEGLEMSYDFAAQISDSFSYSYNTLYLKAGGTYTSSCQECDWIHSTLPAPVILDTPTACFSYTSTATNVTITGYDGSCTSYIKIPETIDGKPVEHIGEYAFYYTYPNPSFNSDENKMLAYNDKNVLVNSDDNNLLASITNYSNTIKKVIFPKALKTIGNNAFENNELTQVIIPNGVTSIGDSAFDQYYSIYSIAMPGNIMIGDIMGYNDSFKEIYDDYYSKDAGIYMRNGCGWINADSALPYPENLCK